MIRLKAASLHFVASVLVLALVYAWLRFTWYPDLLFSKTGAYEIFGLILLVDVMLGPLCTLAVYNPRKASLRFDMATIIAVQVCALCYGVFTLWQARPVYIVFNVDEFTVVTAVDLSGAELGDDQAALRWYPLPQLGPRAIGATLPKDTRQLGTFVMDTIVQGRNLPQLPQYYVPFSEVSDQVTANSRDLSELKPLSEKAAESLRALLQGQPDRKGIGYLPVEAGRQDFVALVDRRDGRLLGYLDVEPPQI